MQRKVLAKYIRVSSEDRDLHTNLLKNESNSVTNQRDLLQDFCDSRVDLREYDVIEFVDDGYSGTSFDRPQFEAMMQQVMDHQIHCIVVKDLSRFGREFIEACAYIELVLPKVGARFISVNDGFDTNDYLGTTGGLELAIRNLMNAMYSQDISNKVRSAIETRNRRGDYWGGSPFYGYLTAPNDRKKLIVDESVREVVQSIFNMCVEGLTTSEIASRLNAQGIPTPLQHKKQRGGLYNGMVKEEGVWLRSAVRNILTDERYTGKMVSNRREKLGITRKIPTRALPRDQWIIVEGTHEAIISEEQFKAVQGILRSRIKTVNQNTAGDRKNNLFVCGYCGRKLQKQAAKVDHMVCPKASSQAGCACSTLYEGKDALEDSVLEAIKKISKSVLEQSALDALHIPLPVSGTEDQVEAAQRRLAQFRVRKRELYEEYHEGKLDRESFAAAQSRLQMEQTTLEESLAHLRAKLEREAQRQEQKGRIEKLSDDVLHLTAYDPNVIRQLVKEIKVFGGGRIEIEFLTECPWGSDI